MTISELRNQILNANALGIANLSDKGITLNENATTYDIMRGISNIQMSGSGGGSVGNLCTHTTSVVYIPTPRYKTNVTVTLPDITHDSSYKMTTRNTVACTYTVIVPNITHETEVSITNG